MEQTESLHSLFTKMSELKKKIADINNKKATEDQQTFISEINNKLDRFVETMENINEYQENVNCKHPIIMNTVQDKSLLCDNSVQLSHTLHDKFIYMIKNKDIFDKLLERLVTHADKSDELHCIINQFKEIHSSSHNEFIESLCEFRSTKGLLNNIKELKEHDWKNNTSISEPKSACDSDLGCYPNDSGNLNGHEKAEPQFTSSPISLIRLDF